MYKKSKKGEDRAARKSEYKKYKKILEKLIRILKHDHYEKELKEAGPDTRRIWGIINECIDRKQVRQKMPSTFNIDGKTVKNKKNIACAFNSYFASIGKEMADSLPDTLGYEQYLTSVTDTQFQLEEVTRKSLWK